jgi:uncharacterized protein
MNSLIEELKKTYDALNRNDIPGFMKIFDPEIERIEPAEIPSDGVFKGLKAVTEHVSKARATWAEGSCKPERFIVDGNRIIVSVHVRVRLKHEKEWREGRVADVFTFADDKVIQFRSVFDEQQILELLEGDY